MENLGLCIWEAPEPNGSVWPFSTQMLLLTCVPSILTPALCSCRHLFWSVQMSLPNVIRLPLRYYSYVSQLWLNFESSLGLWLRLFFFFFSSWEIFVKSDRGTKEDHAVTLLYQWYQLWILIHSLPLFPSHWDFLPCWWALQREFTFQ